MSGPLHFCAWCQRWFYQPFSHVVFYVEPPAPLPERLSHGVCPRCLEGELKPQMDTDEHRFPTGAVTLTAETAASLIQTKAGLQPSPGTSFPAAAPVSSL